MTFIGIAVIGLVVLLLGVCVLLANPSESATEKETATPPLNVMDFGAVADALAEV